MRVLPKGRHGLSRGEVSASQRGRILAAVVDRRGGAGLRREPPSPPSWSAPGCRAEAFYEHFPGKEACFLAAYDAGAEVLRRELGVVLDGGRPRPSASAGRSTVTSTWPRREPAFARTFLIEVYGAGPRALERRLEAQRRFADAIAATLGVAADPRARLACAALVGGVVALVTERVGSGAARTRRTACGRPVGELVADWLGLVVPALAPGGARMSMRLVPPPASRAIPPRLAGGDRAA